MTNIALEVNRAANDEIMCSDLAKEKAVKIQQDYSTFETMFTFSDDSVIVLCDGGYVDVYCSVESALEHVSSECFE